jgi:hypothetical protein
MIVATIRKGYTLNILGNDWLVVGNRSLRGIYCYVVRGVNGELRSIKRTDLLEAQRENRCSVRL